MFKTIRALMAVTILTGTVSAYAQAQEVPVQKGDTLWGISQIHNVSVESIKKINHLSTDIIYPNEKLIILPETHYAVRNGDTLWKVAQDYKVSVKSLKEWNNLITDNIYPGLTLNIFQKQKPVASVKTIKKITSSKELHMNVIGEKPALKITSSPSIKPIKHENHSTSLTSSPNVKILSVKATAYTANCPGCSGKTKIGIDLKSNPNVKVISVDPSVIPLGSKVYVEGYGYAIAGDTGGAIKGNRIDIFKPTQKEAINFGSKQLTVKIIN